MVRRGQMVVYRMFDVADAVDLKRVESLVGERVASRLRLPRSEAFLMRNAPVSIPVAAAEVQIDGGTLRAETLARVWDYGVMSFSFRIPIAAGTGWRELVRMAAAAESEQFFDIARLKCRELVATIAAACSGVHEWRQIEDYTIFQLEEVDGIAVAADITERADVPALLLAETQETLAPSQRAPVLQAAVQYSTRDLAVIDWNAALIFDPTGGHNVADVIEFALTHLVEFRYYDELLDERLALLHDAVSERRTSLLRGDYRPLSREASALFMELSAFIERVENSLKFVGDIYFATIFRTAVTRFRLVEWEQNVSRKIQLLGRVADLLNNEVNARRSQVLEIIVVLLILFE